MKIKVKHKDFDIKVNDIFEELSEENKRLNEELIFANNCLNVLNRFKILFDKIVSKFEETIDLNDRQELSQLEDEFNSIIKSKEIKSETNDEKSEQNIGEINGSTDENTEQLNEKKFVVKMTRLSEETNRRRSGRTELKVNLLLKPKTKLKPKLKPIIPEPEEEPNSLLLLRRDNYDPNTQSYICPNPYCNKSYNSKDLLYRHFRVVHHLKERYFCDHLGCNQGFKTIFNLKSHSISHSNDKPFVCDFKGCDFRCKTQPVLETHSFSHSDIRSFKCDDCELSFKTRPSLSLHRRVKHKSEPTFKCNVEGCHQLFKTYKYLLKHKVNEHNIYVYLYRCEWPGCNYSTRHSSSASTHITRHTGEKRYACEWPDCDKRFRIKAHLDGHLLVHKDLKPLACVWPGCQYRCRISANLTKHLKVHQKYL